MRIDVRTRRERQREEIRADLVAAAHALVKDEGYEGLTIRKLAERAGLATMSVYSYFADKQSILEAMAEDAFIELAKRCEARRTDDALESLRAGLEEYVIFGLDNPNEYRTVFMTPQVHVHQDKTFEDLEAHNPAFQGLLGAVQECIDAGSLSGDARAIATILWTVAHGAVSLILTFSLYPFGEPIAYARRVINLALHGIRDCSIEPLGSAQPLCGGRYRAN
jgi:AcrR family transcriptional regulator